MCNGDNCFSTLDAITVTFSVTAMFCLHTYLAQLYLTPPTQLSSHSNLDHFHLRNAALFSWLWLKRWVTWMQIAVGNNSFTPNFLFDFVCFFRSKTKTLSWHIQISWIFYRSFFFCTIHLLSVSHIVGGLLTSQVCGRLWNWTANAGIEFCCLVIEY